MKHALPRLVHFLAAPRRAIALGVAGQKLLEMIDGGARVGAQLGDFDQPFAAKMLAALLAGDVGQWSLKYSPASTLHIFDFQTPCSPSIVIM